MKNQEWLWLGGGGLKGGSADDICFVIARSGATWQSLFEFMRLLHYVRKDRFDVSVRGRTEISETVKRREKVPA